MDAPNRLVSVERRVLKRVYAYPTRLLRLAQPPRALTSKDLVMPIRVISSTTTVNTNHVTTNYREDPYSSGSGWANVMYATVLRWATARRT